MSEECAGSMNVVIAFNKVYQGLCWALLALGVLMVSSSSERSTAIVLVLAAITSLVSIKFISKTLNDVDLKACGRSLFSRIVIQIVWAALPPVMCLFYLVAYQTAANMFLPYGSLYYNGSYIAIFAAIGIAIFCFLKFGIRLFCIKRKKTPDCLDNKLAPSK